MTEINKLLKIYKLWYLHKKYKLCKFKKRLWSREWLLRRRSQLGACSFLKHELAIEDSVSFKNYIRMKEEDFEKLHEMVALKIQKQNTKLREAISSRDRLIVTLRYLATGESFRSLSYSTRISISAISQFIPTVCSAIYETLKKEYLQIPSSEQAWNVVARKFLESWDIPNTVGAIDGKHIVFRAPKSAGSHYYNYKGTHSVVLLALADADYNFLYIDVGVNGRVSDGGVFQDCDLSVALNRKTLNLPPDKPLPGTIEPDVPYVILADAAFPLQEHILKPYPFKRMTKEERIFNYRLSRGRRVIENAFGILANRFRVLLTPINLKKDTVVLITQACCALHNFLKSGCITSSTQENSVADKPLQSAIFRRGRARNSILRNREIFKHYFNNIHVLEWQSEVA